MKARAANENSVDPGLTELERIIAQRLHDGIDPWAGTHGTGYSRVTASLGRMRRKGFVVYEHARWRLTTAGRVALELARRLEASR